MVLSDKTKKIESMFVMGQERDYIIHDEIQIKGFFGEYRFLSNFHPAPVLFEGQIYPSSENAYQAAKCANLKDRTQFLTCAPVQAKKLSKTILVMENWNSIKYDFMAAIVFDKFYRNLDIRQSLVELRQKYLEETNHWGDVYWGVCNNKGENKLGKILMGTRAIWNSK